MNIDWIMSTIEYMSQIGGTTDGGSNRLGFTESDMIAREYFISLIKEAGLPYRLDNFGNIFARLEGYDKNAPIVATGSHIDTVPNGGHYDGILGSVLSLAAIKKIKADKINHKNPIELIIFQLEESSRFGHATMGSKVIAGKNIMDAWRNAKDKDGLSVPEVLNKAGFDFDKLPMSRRDKSEFKAFVELHIDQSIDLEDAGKPVGIVTAIAAPIRSKVLIKGEATHSGSTKMKNRKDALISASELVLAVRNLALVYSEKGIVATVGNLKVYPGAMNVVPGFAELFIDLRGIDKSVMDEVYAILKSESSKIALRHKTPIEIELLSEESPVTMDIGIRSKISEACEELNISYADSISGAGHDAMNMALLAPAGMIYVRGKCGISHHPAEFAAKEDIHAGFNVLVSTLKKLAE